MHPDRSPCLTSAAPLLTHFSTPHPTHRSLLKAQRTDLPLPPHLESLKDTVAFDTSRGRLVPVIDIPAVRTKLQDIPVPPFDTPRQP